MALAAVAGGAATTLWKIAEGVMTRARETQKANVSGLVDYVDAARLYTAGIALEGQEIVAQAMAITPQSNDTAIQALRERTMAYLLTDKNREGLERALKGINEYAGYLTERNETVSTWPFGDAALRGELLKDVADVRDTLKAFLDKLSGGLLVPGTGLLFVIEMSPAIEAGDRAGIRAAAIRGLQHPSYSDWRELGVRCEEVISALKLKFH
jgi:hypothetical protein